MSGSDMTWNFNGIANRYDEMVSSDSLLYANYDDVLDTVIKTANPQYGHIVLDIGTGTGNLALRCKSENFNVVGLDPNEAMLTIARTKNSSVSNIKFEKAEDPFLKIPYPDRYCDALITTYAFHHIPDNLKPESIREMIRVIKPGGSWVVGDLAFEDRKSEQQALRKYKWLEKEYFIIIDEIMPVFQELGMELQCKQVTPVTWILWSLKPNETTL